MRFEIVQFHWPMEIDFGNIIKYISGKVVLDLLGIEIEAYYASEIATDAIMVTNIRHGSSVHQIGDIKEITDQKVIYIYIYIYLYPLQFNCSFSF
jgi:hypothetical protein